MTVRLRDTIPMMATMKKVIAIRSESIVGKLKKEPSPAQPSQDSWRFMYLSEDTKISKKLEMPTLSYKTNRIPTRGLVSGGLGFIVGYLLFDYIGTSQKA